MLDSGTKVKLKQEDYIRLHRIITGVALLMNGHATQRGIELKTDIDIDAPRFLKARSEPREQLSLLRAQPPLQREGKPGNGARDRHGAMPQHVRAVHRGRPSEQELIVRAVIGEREHVRRRPRGGDHRVGDDDAAPLPREPCNEEPAAPDPVHPFAPRLKARRVVFAAINVERRYKG